MSISEEPKVRRKITLHREKGVKSEGFISLEDFPRDWPVGKMVSAFLEDERAFFPFLPVDTSITELVNKENLYMVEIGCPDEPQGSWLDAGLEPVDFITVILTGEESVISGELMAEAAAAQAGPSDCLNLDNRFICVRGRRKAFYINKKKLQKIVPQ